MFLIKIVTFFEEKITSIQKINMQFQEILKGFMSFCEPNPLSVYLELNAKLLDPIVSSK